MSNKKIYAMIKGDKVVIGHVNPNKEFTFREDIDMSIISKRVWKWLKEMYDIKPKQR